MQRVAHLVCQRELAVERAGVVQQHIRMHRGACGICAGALADVFIDVDPAVVEALLQHLAVVLAHAGQRFQNSLLRIGKLDVRVGLRDQRRIEVIHVQLVHAQQLLAQADIAVHLIEILVDGLDQLMVNARRDLGAVERSLQRRGVFACVGKELQLLDVGVKRRGTGVAEALIRGIVVLKCALAQDAVGRLEAGNIGALTDGMLCAILVHSGLKLQVGVGEHRENVLRGLGHFACGGQQLFFRGRKNVRTAAAALIEITAVQLQLWLLAVELLHLFIGNGQELGCLKAGLGLGLDIRLHKLADHALIIGIAFVLISAAHGVVAKALGTDGEHIHQLPVRQQLLRGLRDPTCKACKLVDLRLKLFQILLPKLVRGVQILQRPLVLNGDLASFRDFFRHI